jgi:putative IMPACT (imprinted ancient) family translation regulator
VRLAVEVPYEKVGAVKRLLRPPEIELEGEEYGAAARLALAVHEEREAALREALAELGIAPR